MSEQGWRDFLAADGTGDWVVLHGGPTAVFETGSMGEAAALAVGVAGVGGVNGSTVALGISGHRLTVRLARDLWAIEEVHVDLARAISAVAAERGAVANRGAVQEVQIAIAAKADMIDLPFWRAVTGYAPMADDNAIDPLGHGSTVWMQPLEENKVLRHAMHVDVSVARERAQSRMEAAVAAGGRVVDDSNAPASWILSDRAGNRVCIAAWPDSPP